MEFTQIEFNKCSRLPGISAIVASISAQRGDQRFGRILKLQWIILQALILRR